MNDNPENMAKGPRGRGSEERSTRRALEYKKKEIGKRSKDISVKHILHNIYTLPTLDADGFDVAARRAIRSHFGQERP
jgi:hypothetical protein